MDFYYRDRKVAVNPMPENVTSHPVFWVNILEDFSRTLLTPACDAVSWCGGCLVFVVALAPSTPRTPKGWSLGCSLPWAPVDSLQEVCACFPLVRLRNPESKQKCLGLKCVDSIVTAHSSSEMRIVIVPAEESVGFWLWFQLLLLPGITPTHLVSLESSFHVWKPVCSLTGWWPWPWRRRRGNPCALFVGESMDWSPLWKTVGRSSSVDWDAQNMNLVKNVLLV